MYQLFVNIDCHVTSIHTHLSAGGLDNCFIQGWRSITCCAFLDIELSDEPRLFSITSDKATVDFQGNAMNIEFSRPFDLFLRLQKLWTLLSYLICQVEKLAGNMNHYIEERVLRLEWCILFIVKKQDARGNVRYFNRYRKILLGYHVYFRAQMLFFVWCITRKLDKTCHERRILMIAPKSKYMYKCWFRLFKIWTWI